MHKSFVTLSAVMILLEGIKDSERGNLVDSEGNREETHTHRERYWHNVYKCRDENRNVKRDICVMESVCNGVWVWV